jgi:hypothetical protein
LVNPDKPYDEYGKAVAAWNQAGRNLSELLVGWLLGGVEGAAAGSSVGVAAEAMFAEVQSRRRKQHALTEAEDLIDTLLGGRRPDRLKQLSYGRKGPHGWHPDHRAAGSALAESLGFPCAKVQRVASPSLPIDVDADLAIIGGPNATPLTMVAWEYRGDNIRELERDPDAIIPLRWFGSAKASEISDTPIGWRLEGVGPIATVNWSYQDTKTRKEFAPRPSRKTIQVDGSDVYLPKDNYLIINRVPNFLHSQFHDICTREPQRLWPSIVVFQGTHGIGTRAAELLMESDGLDVLRSLDVALREVPYFQALLRVTGIDTVGRGSKAFDRFSRVEVVDTAPIDPHHDVYLKAHARGRLALKQLPSWARA